MTASYSLQRPDQRFRRGARGLRGGAIPGRVQSFRFPLPVCRHHTASSCVSPSMSMRYRNPAKPRLEGLILEGLTLTVEASQECGNAAPTVGMTRWFIPREHPNQQQLSLGQYCSAQPCRLDVVVALRQGATTTPPALVHDADRAIHGADQRSQRAPSSGGQPSHLTAQRVEQ